MTVHQNKFKNKKILEIGCGPLSEIDISFCKRNNINYYGIDPERTPVVFLNINLPLFRKLQNAFFSRLANQLKIKKYRLNRNQYYILDRFPSVLLEKNSFDLIYGNSTIEHWHQDEEDMDKSIALYIYDIDICYHLLKDEGTLLINCPIYVHGNKLFMQGKIEIIKNIFMHNKWKRLIFEYWRKDHSDLMPYSPHARKEYFKKQFNIDLDNIWLLNVVAEK